MIIRVTKNSFGHLTLIAIGKGIQETSTDIFAEKFNEYINDILKKITNNSKVNLN